MAVVVFCVCFWWLQVAVHEIGHLLAFRACRSAGSARVQLTPTGGHVQLRTADGWVSPGWPAYAPALWEALKSQSRVRAFVGSGSVVEFCFSLLAVLVLRLLGFMVTAQAVAILCALIWATELVVSLALKAFKSQRTTDLLGLLSISRSWALWWAISLTVARGLLLILASW